jgi:hypothetical protein
MRIAAGSPGVAVALAAVMILRSRASTAIEDVMGTLHMKWCLTSGRIAETVTATNGHADTQGQGRRTIGGSRGETVVETKITAGRPGIGIVTTSPRAIG